MKSKKRKILYISGTRADYGLMRETLFKIQKNPKLEIAVVATGMHIMPEFGNTINEIKKDGFKIYRIEAKYKKDDKESMATFVGEMTKLLAKNIKKINPNMILLLGDRGEMLAGAVVGAYLNIPIAHIHGGDVSGTVDDVVRNAITKLSDIHFPATKKSAERIKKMGVDPRRVFLSGAPGIDGILKEKLFSKKEIFKKYSLDFRKNFILIIQHPVTAEVKDSGKQIKEAMDAVKELGLEAVVIYPNADAGGRKMIDAIQKYRKYPFIKIYKNIPRKDFLSLMKSASVIVGNSSSGIIESPSFHIPSVSIGTREEGRERACNVIDVGYKKNEIKEAIEKAIYDKKFAGKIKKIVSPYGNGEAAKKIVEVLSKINIEK